MHRWGARCLIGGSYEDQGPHLMLGAGWWCSVVLSDPGVLLPLCHSTKGWTTQFNLQLPPANDDGWAPVVSAGGVSAQRN